MNGVHHIAEQFNTHRFRFRRGWKNLDDIAACAKGAAVKIHVVARILNVDQLR